MWRCPAGRHAGIHVEVDQLTGVYKNPTLGIVALVFRCKPSGGTERTSSESTAVSWLTPDEASDRMSEVYAIRLLYALDGAGPTCEATTAFPASSRPAHGMGARRLYGVARLLSSPRLAAPGGALGGCGHEAGRHPLWLGRSAPRL